MRDKTKSVGFKKSLEVLKEFMDKETDNLKELQKTDTESFRERIGELDRLGFRIHFSQFTNEVMMISFWG